MLLPVADCHCDTICRLSDPTYHFARSNPDGQIDLPRLRYGGVSLQFFALCTAAITSTAFLHCALEKIVLYHRLLAENREQLLPVERRNDPALAAAEGKIACLLALEGAEPLQKSLDLLEIFYRLGVRCLSPTWNHRNFFAEGSREEAAGGGLTGAGRRLVQMTGKIGLILDLAHLATRSFNDALELTAKPPLVSHANARALCEHPRNLGDEQLKALAERGGVIGLSFYPYFINGEKQASLEQLADHFVHIAALIGPAHLAFGSDFDGIDCTVTGLENASCYGTLVRVLSRRGFSPTELEQITWGNVIRIIEANLHE